MATLKRKRTSEAPLRIARQSTEPKQRIFPALHPSASRKHLPRTSAGESRERDPHRHASKFLRHTWKDPIFPFIIFASHFLFIPRDAIRPTKGLGMQGTQNMQKKSCGPTRGSGCQVIYSQFGLAVHQNDHQARRRFVEWAQNEIAVVPDFHKRILFSDEAHFWLNGYVNKQNCRIWSEANPQVYVETQLHPEKLTVWCALWAGGILLQKR
ncbi:uncharacterized protein TNCV_2398011 [Trichonephila clavipes]|uniref:Transposase n=1 Tax=Trichonephila clavipes TaxID=2585209 RepID=A0A8X6T294_TRICX|nr:uncharacterized protein TNCV_2398011 [Trichonephila clavipes]